MSGPRRIIGRIDGTPGRRIVVAVGGGRVELELAIDGAVMLMRFECDQAAELERLLSLAQYRAWFSPGTARA